MNDTQDEEQLESIPLPGNWSWTARHAILNVIGIVRIAMLASRKYLIQHGDVPTAHIHRLETEVELLREEARILSSRIARIAPQRRPQYPPIERMAILKLRAMRGWSKVETARHLFVSDDTIRSWQRRVDDDTLLQTATPVNRFPDFIRHTVQQIKLFCPSLGKVKIAETLARVGIHIGKTTVGIVVQRLSVVRSSGTDSAQIANYCSRNRLISATTRLLSGPRLNSFSAWPNSMYLFLVS